MADFMEQEEEKVNAFLRVKSNTSDKAQNIFKWLDSGGWQSQKLAQLTTTFDFTMRLLNWDKRVIMVDDRPKIVQTDGAFLTSLIKVNQTTIDATYHNDYKDIAIAEEKVEKLSKTGKQSPMLSPPS